MFFQVKESISVLSSSEVAEVRILWRRNYKKNQAVGTGLGEAPTQGNKKQHLNLSTALGKRDRLKSVIIKDRGCGGRDEGKEQMNERTVPFLPPLIAQIIINPKFVQGRTGLRQTLNSRGDRTCVLKQAHVLRKECCVLSLVYNMVKDSRNVTVPWQKTFFSSSTLIIYHPFTPCPILIPDQKDWVPQ